MTSDEQISQWVAADQAWVEGNYDILASAYQYFLSSGDWPTVEKMIQQRARQGILDDRPGRVLDSRPLVPGQGPGFKPDKLMLSARHLVHFPEAEPVTALIARATQFGVILIGSPDETPELSREQMIKQPPELTIGRIGLLPAFLQLMMSEQPRPFGGYSMTTDDWHLNIDVMTALKFASVSTIEDFLACQREIIKENLERQVPQIREMVSEFLTDADAPLLTQPARSEAATPFDNAHDTIIPTPGTIENSLLRRAFNNVWVVGTILALVVGILLYLYTDLHH